jgi:3-dehydroquinate synthase
MKLTINLKNKAYDIHIKRGIIKNTNEYVNLDRKVMIVTDDQVPTIYSEEVLKQCQDGHIYTVPSGEVAKSMKYFEAILSRMLELGFTRNDLVIAVGGGVVGDLSGFIASSYMRGIEYVQIPTTILSQNDSSIGGKVAINLNDTKNIVGAFYHPSVVLIDPDTLSTLPQRQISNGLAEVIKHGLIYDKDLFNKLKTIDVLEEIEAITYQSLCVKKAVVEKDEFEDGLRKTLNFGHTIGHAIESYYGMTDYFHGEAVGLGMILITKDEILRKEIIDVLTKFNLPTSVEFDKQELFEFMKHDKKVTQDSITIVELVTIGECKLRTIKIEELKHYLEVTS